MGNSKVLNNLRLELLHLSKSISNDLISDSITRIAMDFDVEYIKWLKSKRAKQNAQNLTHPIVFDVLRFLETLKESHPDGMSRPDFVKYFVGTSNTKYLPTIISLAEIFKSSGSSILEPFADILDHTEIFKSVGEFDTPSVQLDLQTIEHDFRSHLESLINKPYESEPSAKKKRLTKNEKRKELFYFLIDNASQKVASVLDAFGQDVLADQIRSDRLFLVNSEALTKSRLTGPTRDLSYVAIQAQNLAKTILKRVEPDDNEYNYNLLVNTAMKFGMAMSDSEFDKYFYDLMMQKARGESQEVERVDFANRNWIHPTIITMISLTLLIIMSQIKF